MKEPLLSKARMTALLAVGSRPAPVLFEKSRQALDSALEIIFGVHREQNIVGADPRIKIANEPLEGRAPADFLREVPLSGFSALADANRDGVGITHVGEPWGFGEREAPGAL